MTPDEFHTIWTALNTPITSHELEATEVSPGTGVWVARDNADHQHLLVLVEAHSQLELDETRGLKVAVSQHRIAGRDDAPYVDLACLDSGAIQTFATVASEIANAVVGRAPGDRASAVVSAVREWRWFWGVDPSRMSRNEAVGLFGELWFLNRWASVTPASVAAWEGSSGARHDFVWTGSSVEVKTTARGGAPTHTIEHLEQLDDAETGQLFLYSLRIARDALAANSVHSLAQSARHALRDDPVGRTDLMAKLAQRGYTPAGRDESGVTYRVVDEGLYLVDASFPRLTQRDFPKGLPRAIASVSYQLDLAACGHWRTDATPGTWKP